MLEEKEPPPEESSGKALTRTPRKQSHLEHFLVAKHNLRTDVLRLVCEDNISLNRVVTSKTLRRLLVNTYPNDKPPPASAATLRKHLAEHADELRSNLREKFGDLRKRGSCSESRFHFAINSDDFI